MNKKIILDELKNKYIKLSNIKTISFIISMISIMSFFMMLLILFIFDKLDNDVAPILMVIQALLFVISLIVGIILIFKCKNIRGNTDFYKDEDQKNFLSKYLKLQIAEISLLFISLFLIIFGLIKKNEVGATLCFIGMTIFIIITSIIMITSNKKKMLKSNKSKIVEDNITIYSIKHNLNIIERTILIIVLITIVIMIFSVITDKTRIAMNIILIVLSIAFYGYILYTSIKCLMKFNKSKKRT